MVRTEQDAIQTFMSVTGVDDEAAAARKLEEHQGNLNEAINAHFSEGDRNLNQHASFTSAGGDVMDIDDPLSFVSHRPPSPLLSFFGRDLNPFSLLEPNFPRDMFDVGDASARLPFASLPREGREIPRNLVDVGDASARLSFVSRPREAREIPRNIFDVGDASSRLPFVSHPREPRVVPRNRFDVGDASARLRFVSFPREVREIPIEVRGEPGAHGHSANAPIIVDVTETGHEHGPEVRGTVVMDEDENSPSSPIAHVIGHGAGGSSMNSEPSAPIIVDVPDNGNDIEEEMIRAAIKASEQDAAISNQDARIPAPESVQPHPEDAELEHAVSLSLQTAEQEKVLRELEGGKVGASEVGQISAASDEVGKLPSNGRQSLLEVGSSSLQDEVVDLEERPLVRRRRNPVSSGSIETTPPLGPPPSDYLHYPEQIGSDFLSEWGGISSEEHDEAVMLEAAMFGGIPEGGLGGYVGPYPGHVPRSPSPSLAAQRLIREQQNDEYLAALQADQEKELKAKEEAEAALAENMHREEVLRRNLQEEQENEGQLVAKEASLPQEPTAGDENAVTLLVRMPDGSRRGRRFLKTDKLQCLFDFIDVGRVVKPGCYRLVRPYPRRAFSDEESGSTLEELGLTSKQEALYLESI